MSKLEFLVAFWADFVPKMDPSLVMTLVSHAVIPYRLLFDVLSDEEVNCHMKSRVNVMSKSWFGSEIGVATIIF